ncbi:MAG: ABC transporter substrate-binding protein [Bacillota bacterium]
MLNRRRFLQSMVALAGAIAAGHVSGCKQSEAKSPKEAGQVRLSRQYGLGYLPLIIMEEQKLIEKHAAASGLGDLKVTWITVSGGTASTDALLSGSVDYIASGVTPVITAWAKTGGEVKAVAALDEIPMCLNTSNPAVKSIRDFGDKDRIALPSVKVSIQAVALQMAAAKEFGDDKYDKLDRLTVTMKHPDGAAALLSGKSEITGHLTSPPFIAQELKDPRVRTVLNSYDVLGGPHVFNILSTTQEFHNKNPRTYAAVLAALEEAIGFIQKDKQAAAQLYIRSSKSKEPLDEVLAQLNDPSLNFGVAPRNITRFSDFMYRVGSIKTKPADWKELFFPEIHHLKGS